MTAWTRSRTPNLVRTRATCVFTVVLATNKRTDISVLVKPRAMHSSTSSSRAVSDATSAGGPFSLEGTRQNSSISRLVMAGGMRVSRL